MQVSSITNNPKYNDLYCQDKQPKSTVKSEKHTCTVDNYTESFPFKCRLNAHVLADHNTTKYHCDTCDKSCKSLFLLGRHKKIHGNKEYTCITCNKSFFHKSSLVNHAKELSHKVNLTSTKYKYKCGFCIDQFTSKKKQGQHYKKYHPSVKLFSCTACDKSYSCDSSLKRHYEVIHVNKVKQFKCEVCNKEFSYLSGKAKHKKRRHLSVKAKHKKRQPRNKSLLDISNKKTIANNDNQSIYQDNNQDNFVELTNDTMLESKAELKEDKDICNLEEELKEKDIGPLFDLDFPDIVSYCF